MALGPIPHTCSAAPVAGTRASGAYEEVQQVLSGALRNERPPKQKADELVEETPLSTAKLFGRGGQRRALRCLIPRADRGKFATGKVSRSEAASGWRSKTGDGRH